MRYVTILWSLVSVPKMARDLPGSIFSCKHDMAYNHETNMARLDTGAGVSSYSQLKTHLDTGVGGSSDSPNMTCLDTGAGGSSYSRFPRTQFNPCDCVAEFQSVYGERFTRGPHTYIDHASGSRSEPAGFRPSEDRQWESELKGYRIGQIDGNTPHGLEFDRGMGPYRYELHSLDCLRSKVWRRAQGLAIPSWARWDGGRPYDILAAIGAEREYCECHFDFLVANVRNGYIAMSPSQFRMGKVATNYAFVHFVKSVSVRSDLPVASWDTQLDQDPTTYGRTRDWLKAVEMAELNAQPMWRVTVERVARVAGELRASIGATVSALIVPLYTPSVRALAAIRRLSVTPRKQKVPPAPKVPGASRNASRLHFGDNSIEGENAGGMPQGPPAAEQNVLRWLSERATLMAPGIGFDPTGRLFWVSSTLIVPDVQSGGRTTTVTGEFRYWTASTSFSCAITAIYGRPVGMLNNTLAAPFLVGTDAYDTPKVAIALIGKTDLPPLVCKAISPVFGLQLEQFDNTSLYAKGWYLLFLRQAIATSADAYIPSWAAPGDAFTLRNWTSDTLAEDFREDVVSRRFIVDVTGWSANEISCLAHIARAGVALTRAIGVDNPYAAGVSWFAVDIAVYRTQAWGAYIIRDFQPREMLIVLRRLAESRLELQYLGAGFMLSAPFFHTVMTEGPTAASYMVTSALAEPMLSHRWSRPSAANALWSMLGMNVAPAVSHMPAGEVAVLMNGSVADMFNRHACVAAMMSLGVGMAMQRCNLTGRVLVGLSGLIDIPGNAAGIRNQLIVASADQPSCGLLMHAVSEISNVTEVSIGLGAWAGYSWANNLDRVTFTAQARLWGDVWDFRVPYVLKGFALSLFLARWPDLFGVFTGNVTLDLKADLQRAGEAAGWYASKGERRYTAICVGSGLDAVRYIPYGVAVVNALTLYSRRVAAVERLAQRFPRDSTAHTIGVQLAVPDQLLPSDYVEGMLIMQVGVLRTYDWFTDETIAPVVPGSGLSAVVWALCKDNGFRSHMYGVGVLLPTLERREERGAEDFDLRAVYGALPAAAAAREVPPAEEAPMLENQQGPAA